MCSIILAVNFNAVSSCSLSSNFSDDVHRGFGEDARGRDVRLRGAGREDHPDAGVVGDDRRTEEEERTQTGRRRPRGARLHGQLRLLKIPPELSRTAPKNETCERKL